MAIMNPDNATVEVGKDGEKIIMRPPTDPELNKMRKDRVSYTMIRGKDFSIEDKGNIACVKLARACIIDAEGFEWVNASGEILPLNKSTIFSDDDKSKLSEQIGRKVDVWHDLIRDIYMQRAGLWWELSAIKAEEETEKN